MLLVAPVADGGLLADEVVLALPAAGVALLLVAAVAAGAGVRPELLLAVLAITVSNFQQVHVRYTMSPKQKHFQLHLLLPVALSPAARFLVSESPPYWRLRYELAEALVPQEYELRGPLHCHVVNPI